MCIRDSSTEELSQFFANLVQLGGKCALVFINVFASTFKDDLADGAVGALFQQLDENEDGFLDKEELSALREGVEAGKEHFNMMFEMMSGEDAMCDPGMAIAFKLMTQTMDRCKAAGDMAPEAFYELSESVLEAQIKEVRELVTGDSLPVPPEIIEKFLPFIDTAFDTLQSAFKDNMRAVTDAYFEILDANSDGVLQQSELMAIVGIVDKDVSAEDAFEGLFAMVDSDGDGKISADEGTAFAKKVFDLVVCSLQNGVAVYQAVINAVAQVFLKFFLDAIAGGEELTSEKFQEIAASFAEDGPESLMAPLMMG
eukprot:TRINITY_DN542_c0_g1_i1.p1 TRINITY_DN542_c0_g1~~TRINITY_DN542_c0_g1_i1.p1  ORF type:complete len:312 (+),score=144.56 TRINITY_DN542_c0_g1_i1:120-1055(+)